MTGRDGRVLGEALSHTASTREGIRQGGSRKLGGLYEARLRPPNIRIAGAKTPDRDRNDQRWYKRTQVLFFLTNEEGNHPNVVGFEQYQRFI